MSDINELIAMTAKPENSLTDKQATVEGLTSILSAATPEAKNENEDVLDAVPKSKYLDESAVKGVLAMLTSMHKEEQKKAQDSHVVQEEKPWKLSPGSKIYKMVEQALENYLEQGQFEFEVYEDPKVWGSYAIQVIKVPKGQVIQFLIRSPDPIDAEHLEEVEFRSWPPASRGESVQLKKNKEIEMKKKVTEMSVRRCTKCAGKGKRMVTTASGKVQMQPCDLCGGRGKVVTDSSEKQTDHKLEEDGTKTWIDSKVNGALISLGVPQSKWAEIENSIYSAMLSGKLGDGKPSDETAQAIANMVTELAGTLAAPVPEISKAQPDVVGKEVGLEEPIEVQTPEEPVAQDALEPEVKEPQEPDQTLASHDDQDVEAEIDRLAKEYEAELEQEPEQEPEQEAEPEPTQITATLKPAEITIKDVDPEQLGIGIRVELDHTDDEEVAKTIALQHLKTEPKYYSKAKPEDWGKKELKKESLEGETREQEVDSIIDVVMDASPSDLRKIKNILQYYGPDVTNLAELKVQLQSLDDEQFAKCYKDILMLQLELPGEVEYEESLDESYKVIRIVDDDNKPPYFGWKGSLDWGRVEKVSDAQKFHEWDKEELSNTLQFLDRIGKKYIIDVVLSDYDSIEYWKSVRAANLSPGLRASMKTKAQEEPYDKDSVHYTHEFGTHESFQPQESVMVETVEGLVEGKIVDVRGEEADVELDEGVLIIVPVELLSHLQVDDEHVEQILAGEDTVKILDEMVREETLQRV